VEKTFEYRIYPTATQQELIQKTFGCCRWVYNKVLALRQEEYDTTRKTVSHPTAKAGGLKALTD
jgi:putative transposase